MASKPTEQELKQELAEAEKTLAELGRAVPALRAWLDSQELEGRRAVVLLGMTIGTLLDEEGISERGLRRILGSLGTCIIENNRRNRA